MMIECQVCSHMFDWTAGSGCPKCRSLRQNAKKPPAPAPVGEIMFFFKNNEMKFKRRDPDAHLGHVGAD